jgi:hypothetical protein
LSAQMINSSRFDGLWACSPTAWTLGERGQNRGPVPHRRSMACLKPPAFCFHPWGPNLSSLRQLRLYTTICQIGSSNERLSITGSLGHLSRRRKSKSGGVGPDYWIHLTRGPRHRGDWAISSRGTGGEIAFAFRRFPGGLGAPGA